MSIVPSSPVCTVDLSITYCEGAAPVEGEGPVEAISAGVAAWVDDNAHIQPSFGVTVVDPTRVTVVVEFSGLEDSEIGLTGALVADPENGVARACVIEIGPWTAANPDVIESVKLDYRYEGSVLLINDGQ